MDIDLDELAAILPKLSITTTQEIHIRILEARLEKTEAANTELRHHIDILQQAIKEQ